MFFLALSGRPAAFVFSLVALLDILEGCTRAPAVVKKKKEKMKEKRRQKEPSSAAQKKRKTNRN